MKELIDIFEWIANDMKFDTWYQVQSETQKLKIIQLMISGLIPDCEFNSDYTQFRKCNLAFSLFFMN